MPSQSVADYLQDVGVAAAFGPYSLLKHGSLTLESIMETDYDEAVEHAAYGAGVELGALGMQYSMLKVLNAVQGPKYAMSFHQLHTSLNPMRGIIVKRAVTAAIPLAVPAVAYGGATAYIQQMEKYAPEAPNERSAFWKSVGAALAGTFGGMPGVGDY